MIQERMEPLITLAVQDDVEYYLFYTEGWEERFFFSFLIISLLTGLY